MHIEKRGVSCSVCKMLIYKQTLENKITRFWDLLWPFYKYMDILFSRNLKLTPFDIDVLIKIYIDQDKAPSAKCMYHLLKDIFREAWAQGWNNKKPVD